MKSFGTRRPWSLSIVAGALALAGCGGTSDSRGGPGAASPGPSPGDAASATGAGGGAVDTDGGSPSAVRAEATGSVEPPGVYLTSESVEGSLGPCAVTTLGDVLAAIRNANPPLADILTIYNPATATTDGSFIYAYDVGVLGFDVVFKRGLGDCPAGCTENEYWYFSTDGACQPVSAGHYHAAWGTGSCLMVDGAPLWGRPTPPDPLTVCGQDNTARDLRGTYELHATGQLTRCSLNATNPSAVDVRMKLVIQQDPRDLSTGAVTFSLTGDPLVDGVALPARFQRERFDATTMSSNLPSVCPRQTAVTAHYDFEGYEPGGIEEVDVGDDSCSACKGSLSLALASGATKSP